MKRMIIMQDGITLHSSGYSNEEIEKMIEEQEAATEDGLTLEQYRCRQLPNYEKIRKVIQADAKREPRIHIIKRYGISSDTFYRWIKNPDKYLEKYSIPDKVTLGFAKELIRSKRDEAHSAELIREVLSDLNLEDAEIKFIYLYTIYRNGTEAMIRLNFGDEATENNRYAAKYRAMQWLKKENVRQGIQRVLEWELDTLSITLKNDIISQLYRQAFYDPAMFITAEGAPRFKTLEEIPIEWRCCVDSIKTNMHPKNTSVITYEIKLADRGAARRELSKYIKLYEDAGSGLSRIGEGLEKIAQMAAANSRRAKMEQAEDAYVFEQDRVTDG